MEEVHYGFNISTSHFKDGLDRLPIDDQYNINSSSTTTASSPVISHHSDISAFCPCHDLLSTSGYCEYCHKPSMVRLDLDKTKKKLNRIRHQKSSLYYEYTEYIKRYTQLKQLLLNKEEGIDMMEYSTRSLQKDMVTLKEKCKEEAAKIVSLQRIKETVKKELEELSQKLFEEAEKMIVVEKKEQEELRHQNSHLTSQLDTFNAALKQAQSELHVLRHQMETVPRLPTPDTYTRAQLEIMVMHGADIPMETLEDDGVLMDFNDFVESITATPLRKMHMLKYMKYCLREDIEPCLRFGPNPRMASRKIIDAILVKTCFIEVCPDGFQAEEPVVSLWERFTTTSGFSGCQACGRESEHLPYRFRISYFDEWACIDTYCRDRILSVIEFYSFLQHLRVGAYKHRSLHELYQEFIRLKLQMFLARMGALPTMLEQCGLDPVDVAKAFRGEDINHGMILVPDDVASIERLSSSTESTMTSFRTSLSF